MDYVIEMLDITKKFPGVIANDKVTFKLKKGEIHNGTEKIRYKKRDIIRYRILSFFYTKFNYSRKELKNHPSNFIILLIFTTKIVVAA